MTTQDTQMRIGVMLSHSGRTTAADIRSYARHAEEVGLDSVFIGDHLAAVRPILDSVVTLTTVAAVTERIQVGFGVLILPLRPVAWAAKQVAAMQQMSGGRVLLGVGAGGQVHGTAAWDAVGVPFASRWRRFEEALRVLPDLVSGAPTIVDGTEITLAPGAEMPPVLVGGMSPAAMRRAIRYGDAWFPSMMPPDDVVAGAARLVEFARDQERPAPDIVLGGAAWLGSGVVRSEVDGFVRGLVQGYGAPEDSAVRVPILGSVREAVERFEAYASAGVKHLVLGTFGGDWREQCELIAEARALAHRSVPGQG